MIDYREFQEPEPEKTKAGDTRFHGKTKISGRQSSEGSSTTVFKFRDPRSARSRIYEPNNGLPWVVTDLIRITNYSIEEKIAEAKTDTEKKELEAKVIKYGAIVQVAVNSIGIGDKVIKPQTTDDSPAYASLPYKYVLADEGYPTAVPALPKEALIHFKIPDTVIDLIPNLKSKIEEVEKEYGVNPRVRISLQLLEATTPSAEEAQRQLEQAEAYQSQEDNLAFAEAVEAETHQSQEAAHSAAVSEEWAGLVDQVKKDREETPDQETQSTSQETLEDKQKKLSKRLGDYDNDFKFGS